MSSKYIFDIKIPVIPYDDRDYNEREASEICKQRDLNFSRILRRSIIMCEPECKPAPFYIFCTVEIKG